MNECMKWIEDFYLEEVILFQIRQHIAESGKSDKLLYEEMEATVAEAGRKKEMSGCGRDDRRAKAQRVAKVASYAIVQKRSYDASIDEVEERGVDGAIAISETDDYPCRNLPSLSSLHNVAVALIRSILLSYDRRHF